MSAIAASTASIVEIGSNSIAYWEEQIAASWRDSVEGIIETGRRLNEARKALEKKFDDMLLPFGERTSDRLQAIAKHNILGDATISSHLPPSWTTLYELSQLDDEELAAAIADGRVHPDMKGSEVKALRGPASIGKGRASKKAAVRRAVASTVSLDEWRALSEPERLEYLQPHNFPADVRFTWQGDKTGIEWASWSWNPVTGCHHDCPYCYARDIATRFKGPAYPYGFEPAFRPEMLNAPAQTEVPSEAKGDTRFRNVFTCSMADLFGRWVPPEWIEAVLAQVRENPQWNFLFLTKFPKRMAEFDIPANAWMGTTVDLQARVPSAEAGFARITSTAGVRWLSVEPMLEPLQFKRLDLFQWVVIGGASTSSKTPEFHPPFAWIVDLVAQARAAGARVYFKDNLLGNRILELPFDAPIVGDPTEAPEVFHYLGKDRA